MNHGSTYQFQMLKKGYFCVKVWPQTTLISIFITMIEVYLTAHIVEFEWPHLISKKYPSLATDMQHPNSQQGLHFHLRTILHDTCMYNHAG